MKKQLKITIVVIGLILVSAIVLFNFYPCKKIEPSVNKSEKINATKVYINETKRKLFEVNQDGFVVITEELLLLMENLIKEEDPEILIKTFFLSARPVMEHSNQINAMYVSPSTIPESPHATIIFDLDKEEIISIEKLWWDIYGPVCCEGITFQGESLAKNIGYTNCTLVECEAPPTNEEKQNWICPEIEHIDCAFIKEKLPYCNTTYGDWIGKNCNISFSY